MWQKYESSSIMCNAEVFSASFEHFFLNEFIFPLQHLISQDLTDVKDVTELITHFSLAFIFCFIRLLKSCKSNGFEADPSCKSLELFHESIISFLEGRLVYYRTLKMRGSYVDALTS